MYETSDDKFIENTKTLVTNSYSKKEKVTRKDLNLLKELIEVFNYPNQQIHIPDFEIGHYLFGIELLPVAYELFDINASIEQKNADCVFELNKEADTISMNSVLKTSNPIILTPNLKKSWDLQTLNTKQ